MPNTEQSVADAIWNSFIKTAALGVNTTTAMAGAKAARPKPGRLNIPKRMVIGVARGFKPGKSLDGLKDN